MKKMTKSTEVKFEVPTSLASRLETLEGMGVTELAKKLLTEFYDDKRRTTILVKRMGISWHPSLYSGLAAHVGRGQISQWCRQVIYDDLVTYERGIVPPPNWKEHMAAHKIPAKRVVPDDRNTVVSPLILPQDWFDVMESRWPGKVSTYCKAVIQTKLEKETKKQYELSRGMGDFMSRD